MFNEYEKNCKDLLTDHDKIIIHQKPLQFLATVVFRGQINGLTSGFKITWKCLLQKWIKKVFYYKYLKEIWFEIWILWRMDEPMWVLKVCGKGDLVGKDKLLVRRKGCPKISFCRDYSPGNQNSQNPWGLDC